MLSRREGANAGLTKARLFQQLSLVVVLGSVLVASCNQSAKDPVLANRAYGINRLAVMPPVDGSALKVEKLAVAEEPTGSHKSLRIRASMDTQADYMEFYACATEGERLCLPSKEKPYAFTLHNHSFPDSPAGLLEVGVRACVAPERAIDPAKACGAWAMAPASLTPNAKDELSKGLSLAYQQEASIKNLGAELVAALRAYVQSAGDADTSDLKALVANQLALGPHLLGEILATEAPYLATVVLSEADTAAEPAATPQEEAGAPGLGLVEGTLVGSERIAKMQAASLLSLGNTPALADPARAPSSENIASLRSEIRAEIPLLPAALKAQGEAMQGAMEAMLRNKAAVDALIVKHRQAVAAYGLSTDKRAARQAVDNAKAEVELAQGKFKSSVDTFKQETNTLQSMRQSAVTPSSETRVGTPSAGSASDLPGRASPVAFDADGNVSKGIGLRGASLLVGTVILAAVGGTLAATLGLAPTPAPSQAANTLVRKLAQIHTSLVSEKRKLLETYQRIAKLTE